MGSSFSQTQAPRATEDTPATDSRRAKKRSRRMASQMDDGPTASLFEGRRLFIGNIAYATSKADLKDFFKDYLIESAFLPFNPQASHPAGYAFVDMATPAEAERAISELNDEILLDRKVLVVLARQPKQYGAKDLKQVTSAAPVQQNVAPAMEPEEGVTSTAPQKEQPKVLEAGEIAQSPALYYNDLPAAEHEEAVTLPTLQHDQALSMHPEEVVCPSGNKDLKRPLSPVSVALGNQAPKRVRAEAEGAGCQHCGCSSHRWTACTDACLHCGVRHMGTRCPVLPVARYMPGGFKANKYYRPPEEHLPALKLTPVDVAVPDYTTTDEVDHTAPYAQPTRIQFGEAPAGDTTTLASVVASVEAASTMTDVRDSKVLPAISSDYSPPPSAAPAIVQPTQPALSSWPTLPNPFASSGLNIPRIRFGLKPSQAPAGASTIGRQSGDDAKMDAARAALIENTSDDDFQPSAPLDHEPALGPMVSGENVTPLGRRSSRGASANVKVECQPEATNSTWAHGGTTSNGPAVAANTSISARASGPRFHFNSPAQKPLTFGAFGTQSVSNARNHASQQPRVNANPKAAVPEYGQTLFGNNITDNIANSGFATTAPQPAASSGTVAAVPNGDANTTTAQDKKNDNTAWSILVEQIKKAVKQTQRPGKAHNGVMNIANTDMRVNEALKILKPIVLGLPGGPVLLDNKEAMGVAAKATASTRGAHAQQPPQTSRTMVPRGGGRMQPPPQSPRAMRLTGSLAMQPPIQPQGTMAMGGFAMQPPPQPPQGSMTWNWATGTWQWTWQ